MLPSPYEGFVEGSIFIIKVGGFNHGFYLSQQLKELKKLKFKKGVGIAIKSKETSSKLITYS